MNELASFDVLAKDYDGSFTQSLIGQSQREASRKWLKQFLDGRKHLEILEINCGTGVDAKWLASLGHRVTATDASAEMIRIAKENEDVNLRFFQASFNQILENFGNRKFDLVFSNFAGLNCLSPEDARDFLNGLVAILQPGGHIAMVVFGKACLWEQLYYLLRLKPSYAFRRRRASVQVNLKEEVWQEVHYFSLNQVISKNKFSIESTKPIGLFIPPTYLEGMMQNHPLFFRILNWMERKCSFSLFSGFADHCYVLIKCHP